MTVSYSLKFLVTVLLITILAKVLGLISSIPYFLLGFSIGAWIPVIVNKLLKKRE